MMRLVFFVVGYLQRKKERREGKQFLALECLCYHYHDAEPEDDFRNLRMDCR